MEAEHLDIDPWLDLCDSMGELYEREIERAILLALHATPPGTPAPERYRVACAVVEAYASDRTRGRDQWQLCALEGLIDAQSTTASTKAKYRQVARKAAAAGVDLLDPAQVEAWVSDKSQRAHRVIRRLAPDPQTTAQVLDLIEDCEERASPGDALCMAVYGLLTAGDSQSRAARYEYARQMITP